MVKVFEHVFNLFIEIKKDFKNVNLKIVRYEDNLIRIFI